MTKRGQKKLGKMEETGRRLKEQSQEIEIIARRVLTLWHVFIKQHLPESSIPVLDLDQWYSAKLHSHKRSIGNLDRNESSPKKLKTETGCVRKDLARQASDSAQNMHPRPPWDTYLIQPLERPQLMFIAWDNRMFETDGELPSFKKTNVLPDKPPKPRQRYIQRGTLNSSEKNDRRRAQNREAAQRSRQKKLWQDKCLGTLRKFLEEQYRLMEQVIRQWVADGRDWVTENSLKRQPMDVHRLSVMNCNANARIPDALAKLTKRPRKIRGTDPCLILENKVRGSNGEVLKLPPMPPLDIPSRPVFESDSDSGYTKHGKRRKRKKNDRMLKMASEMTIPPPPSKMMQGHHIPPPPRIEMPESESSMTPFGMPPPPLPPPNMSFTSQVSNASIDGLPPLNATAVSDVVKEEMPPDLPPSDSEYEDDERRDGALSEAESETKFEMRPGKLPQEFSFSDPVLSPQLKPDFQITTPEMPCLTDCQSAQLLQRGILLGLLYAHQQQQQFAHFGTIPTLPPALMAGNYGVDPTADEVSDNTNSPGPVKVEEQTAQISAMDADVPDANFGYENGTDVSSMMGYGNDADFGLDPAIETAQSVTVSLSPEHFQYGNGDFMDIDREVHDVDCHDLPPNGNETEKERAAAEALSAMMHDGSGEDCMSLECGEEHNDSSVGMTNLEPQLSLDSTSSLHSDYGSFGVFDHRLGSLGGFDMDMGSFQDDMTFGNTDFMLSSSNSLAHLSGDDGSTADHGSMTTLDIMTSVSDFKQPVWSSFMGP